MDINPKITGALNDLLTRTYDAEKRYRDAANSVNDPELRKWLFDNAERRKRFIKELEDMITAYGATPDQGTSLLGELHIAWLDFKSDFLQNDPVAVLEECRKGEQRTLEDYQKAMNSTVMPPKITNMLERHRQEFTESINGLKALLPAYRSRSKQ